MECESCAFGLQFPITRPENQSLEFFEAAFATGGDSKSSYFNETRKREIAKLELEFISSLSIEEGLLLDIGAGAGIFAEVAAIDGWSVTAVDPALDVSRYSKYS